MYEVRVKFDTVGNKDRNFRVNDIVRHFKGNLYRIVTFARNTETREKEVIYESLYEGEDGIREVWARPYKMFKEKVDREKYPNVEQEYRMEIVGIMDVLK